ncbi:MAG TPA: hypothetical protein VHM20_06725 [Gammaproteobacteria bacterium]|jgi:hypothetical protein|nr:hypothetical protein [Gammaproteobacteria bacterium]
MSTTRLISNALASISTHDKSNILKGGASGFVFGGIAGMMASHEDTPNRCATVFNSACIGGVIGAGTAPFATRLLDQIAKSQNRQPYSPNANTLFTLWASKVTGFTAAHSYAKNTIKKNEEREQDLNFASRLGYRGNA